MRGRTRLAFLNHYHAYTYWLRAGVLPICAHHHDLPHWPGKTKNEMSFLDLFGLALVIAVFLGIRYAVLSFFDFVEDFWGMK